MRIIEAPIQTTISLKKYFPGLYSMVKEEFGDILVWKTYLVNNTDIFELETIQSSVILVGNTKRNILQSEVELIEEKFKLDDSFTKKHLSPDELSNRNEKKQQNYKDIIIWTKKK